MRITLKWFNNFLILCNKNTIKIFVCSLIFYCSCNKEPNYTPTFKYTVFDSINSGLPASFVTKIIADNLNNIWVGTFSSGLVKFDGTNWIRYHKSNSQLPSDTIISLYVDKYNRVYIGTSNGLAIIDQGVWTIYNIENSGLKAGTIFSICTDQNDNMWVGAVSHKDFDNLSGLYFFDGNNWTLYNRKNSILTYDAITSIVCDKSNTIWFGTAQFQGKGGLFSINNNHWSLYSNENSPLKYNTVDRIILGSDGTLLLSSEALLYLNTGKHEGYLYLFDSYNKWSDLSPANKSSNLTNRVTATAFDKKGNIWVATSIDPSSPNIDYSLAVYVDCKWFVLSPKLGNFPRSYIPDMTIDLSNNLWIAAPGAGGIIKINGI